MSAIAKRLETIKDKGALKAVDIAQLVDSRPETVSRWNQGKAYPRRDAERIILELEFIVDQLSDFYQPNEARQWIFSRQKLLNGISPAELIQTGKIEEVLRLVNQLRDGVYI